MDREEMLRVLRAFQTAGLEYVLIGATAMAFHGIVRATEDVDLFVRATPENIERLRRALRAVYDDPEIDDHNLKYIVRLPKYDGSLRPRLDHVWEPFAEQMVRAREGVNVTTDYRSMD